MAVGAAFLSTCRTRIAASQALADFQTSYAAFIAGTATDQPRLWRECFSDHQAGMSPHYRLKKEIRDAVTAANDGTWSGLDIEGAYQTLQEQYAPVALRPTTALQDAKILKALEAESYYEV